MHLRAERSKQVFYWRTPLCDPQACGEYTWHSFRRPIVFICPATCGHSHATSRRSGKLSTLPNMPPMTQRPRNSEKNFLSATP